MRPQAETITVTFDAGYGSQAGSAPKPLHQAILMLVAHWFQNRETVNVGNIVTELDYAVKALLQRYRVDL